MIKGSGVGSGSNLWLMDPDPGGPKTRGSGSRSATLLTPEERHGKGEVKLAKKGKIFAPKKNKVILRNQPEERVKEWGAVSERVLVLLLAGEPALLFPPGSAALLWAAVLWGWTAAGYARLYNSTASFFTPLTKNMGDFSGYFKKAENFLNPKLPLATTRTIKIGFLLIC
jgi:hypothetical protein